MTVFASLHVRNYRTFAAGSLLSNIGTWMQRVAQDWLVLVVTGSAGPRWDRERRHAVFAAGAVAIYRSTSR